MAMICVLRQFYFPGDVRVRREVEALTMAGHQVDVVCLHRAGEPRYERRGSTRIYRLPPHRRRGGPLGDVLEYVTFLVLAGVLLTALHLRRRYDVIQVNSVPDTLVFAALVPRMSGVPVLLDLHESMPEFFDSKFKTGLDHPLVRTVAWLEQASIRFARFAVTCTDQMRETFVARGAPPDKVTVVLNSADETIFDPDRHPPQPRRLDRFGLISHGTVEERYGLDTIIRAVALLNGEIQGLRLEIYGNGSYLDELKRLAEELGVADKVYFSGAFVPIEELLDAIAAADAGVVAMKRDAFRDITQCNKMYDLISMRRPAIVSRTRSVEAYFDDTCFQMFKDDDEHDLARAIRELHADPGLGARLVDNATIANAPYRWPVQREAYLQVIDGLLAANGEGSSRSTGRFGRLLSSARRAP